MCTTLSLPCKSDPIAITIRTGIVNIARDRATVGQTIFVPLPAWIPAHGGSALIPLTVSHDLGDGNFAGIDREGTTWAVFA